MPVGWSPTRMVGPSSFVAASIEATVPANVSSTHMPPRPALRTLALPLTATVARTLPERGSTRVAVLATSSRTHTDPKPMARVSSSPPTWNRCTTAAVPGSTSASVPFDNVTQTPPTPTAASAVASSNDDTTATSPSRPNTSRTPHGMRRTLTPTAVPWQAVSRAPTYRMSGPDGTTARGDDDHRPTHRHRARR